ncbi:MAG: exodeoxyribonuclease VII large subunit [Methanobrevibacter sp.]|nr:exodeoxyribonuclease VII large subunit [Methanobrevibacter sp.]
MVEEYITVSKVTDYIGELIGSDSNLKHIFIKGELSNVKLYRSGHLYFTLKDDESQIRGVMFGAKYKLKFKPKDGMNVLIEGKIEVYKNYGTYQLYVSEISKDGIGDLHRRFEELKEKLNKEGLFDESHKKRIPNFPNRIGVVTAANGAAIRDIITTIKRRWPLCEVILFPSLVQGEKAAENIVYQIKRSENYNLDTLIVGRGGGSIEDLWSFNEEIVARAIYECTTPVISAVGHEIDFTISDLVADLRAPTPTAAAEIAVPPYGEIKNALKQLETRINLAVNKRFDENKSKLDYIVSKKLFINPREIYAPKEMLLDNVCNRLEHSSKSIILVNKSKLDIVKNSNIFKNPEAILNNQKENYLLQISKLDVLNPLNTLKRGYALAKWNGKVISSSKDVKSGDELEVEFDDGNVNTRVI